MQEEKRAFQLVEYRASATHFLKLVRYFDTSTYCVMLRKASDKAEDAVVCSREYHSRAAGLRTLKNMHSQLLEVERIGEEFPRWARSILKR